jgi:hypothetical protein
MKKIWFFVEGNDDESLISRFLRKIQFSFDYEIIKYRELEKGKVNKYLKSIEEKNDDYLFLADFENGPCIGEKKIQLINSYSELKKEKIIIVKKEIESWYLALISENFAKEISIDPNILIDTSFCTKKKFEDIMRKTNYKSETVFKQDILINFNVSDIDLARQRNSSLDYFIKKIESLKKENF